MAQTNYDNKFYGTINAVVDCVIVGLLWIVTSIPIITMGASTTALYYVVNKSIRNGRGYIWKEYWPAFRKNFKQATLTWLIFIVLGLILFYDINLMRQALEQQSKLGMMYYFFLVISAVALAWEFYVFPYIARFECTIKEALKKTFVMMIVNIGWSALLVAVFLACVFLCNDMQFLFFLLPGGFGYVKAIILEKVFKKYRTPEDIKKELEENRIEIRK